jgi:allantoin racemase
MIDQATAAVAEDGAEAVVPGCMSLAYMQVHDKVAAELGVPFLDPLAISLETATMWARHGIQHSPITYPSFDCARYQTLFD